LLGTNKCHEQWFLVNGVQAELVQIWFISVVQCQLAIMLTPVCIYITKLHVVMSHEGESIMFYCSV